MPISTVLHTQSRRTRLPKALTLALCLIPLLVLFSCNRADKNANEIVAFVGNSKITKAQYEQRYHDLTQRQGLPANADLRQDLLNEMIDEEVLLNAARRLRMDRTPDAEQRRQLIEQALLLDRYAEQFILPEINITRNELETLYLRMQTTVTARHLHAQTFAEAQILRERLQNGESWSDLAAEVFTDPTLRHNAGQLDPFTVDEMDPAFEEAAYTLPLNTVSEPVKLKHGYSVLEVLDRSRPPMITEQQFLEKATNLEMYLRTRKRTEATRAHAKAVRDELQLSFRDEVLASFHDQWQLAAANEGPILPAMTANTPNDLLNRELLTTADGAMRVTQVLTALSDATATELGWVDSPAALADLIAGLLVRERMLTIAREQGLDRDDAYTRAVRYEFDTWLLTQVEDDILASTTIPDDSLRALLAREHDSFAKPERLALSGIIVNSRKDADAVEGGLRDGKPFARLAREYSSHEGNASRSGSLGLYARKDLGTEVSALWKLEPGQWLGPVDLEQNHFGFFRVDNRIPGEQPTFDEIRDELVTVYKQRNRRALLKDFVARERADLVIEVRMERLDDIQMAGVY